MYQVLYILENFGKKNQEIAQVTAQLQAHVKVADLRRKHKNEIFFFTKKLKNVSCKIDDDGNAMFQSYLYKLSKKKPAEDTLVPPLWGTREENVCFLG